MSNAVVHFEIMGPRGEELGTFYTDLFGWKGEWVSEMSYSIIDTFAGEGINGGIGGSQDGSNSLTFYVEAADLQLALDKAVTLGGKIVQEVTEIPNVVTFAKFADPEGNVIGLVTSAVPGQEAPGVSAGTNPAIGWFEVLGQDGLALQTFYKELFGWTIKGSAGMPSYGEVEAVGAGIPGAVGSVPQGQPNVTVYAQVDDVQKWLEKAELLGAKTVLEPFNPTPDTTVAAFKDPQENIFGLYRYVKS
ncbi:MAG: VOC family protein [Actinomycetota bacterium]